MIREPPTLGYRVERVSTVATASLLQNPYAPPASFPKDTAVQSLDEVPGLGVDSVQQILAEVGTSAATFP